MATTNTATAPKEYKKHLRLGNGKPACGTKGVWGYEFYLTTDPTKVNCTKCLRKGA